MIILTFMALLAFAVSLQMNLEFLRGDGIVDGFAAGIRIGEKDCVIADERCEAVFFKVQKIDITRFPAVYLVFSCGGNGEIPI